MRSLLPEMSRPPVHEVVCGISFQRLAKLTPQLVGAYWFGRRSDFPTTETKMAVGSVFSFGGDTTAPSLRTWLVSEGGDFLVQIQDDRFFLNWRSRDQKRTYPRFDPAICGRALDEFSQFKGFCAREIGEEPAPAATELAKINLLYQARHWKDWNDLQELVPMLRPIFGMNTTPVEPSVSMRLTDKTSSGPIAIAVEIGVESTTNTRVAKIENKVVRSFLGDLRADFLSANDELNRFFAHQVPEHLMRSRFNGGLG